MHAGKYIPAKGCNKVRVHFYFLVEVLLLRLLRAAGAAQNMSTEAEASLFLFGGYAAAALHSSRGMC